MTIGGLHTPEGLCLGMHGECSEIVSRFIHVRRHVYTLSTTSTIPVGRKYTTWCIDDGLWAKGHPHTQRGLVLGLDLRPTHASQSRAMKPSGINECWQSHELLRPWPVWAFICGPRNRLQISKLICSSTSGVVPLHGERGPSARLHDRHNRALRSSAQRA